MIKRSNVVLVYGSMLKTAFSLCMKYLIWIDTITRLRKVGGQWTCDYTIQGHESYIYYLIWFNHSVTVRKVFASEVETLIKRGKNVNHAPQRYEDNAFTPPPLKPGTAFQITFDEPKTQSPRRRGKKKRETPPKDSSEDKKSNVSGCSENSHKSRDSNRLGN